MLNDKSHRNFFIIQISYLLMFFSDKWIISVFFNADVLSVYDVNSRIFVAGSLAWTAILNLYWSKFRINVTSGNVVGVRTDLRTLHIAITSALIVAIFLTLNTEFIIQKWIGILPLEIDNIEFTMLFSTAMSMSAAMYAVVLNGFADMKIQTRVSFVTAICNIPLSIFFASVLNWGPVGVPMATGCLLLFTTLVLRKRVIEVLK
jgi:O-antigen/teichoic acid export membrane protein